MTRLIVNLLCGPAYALISSQELREKVNKHDTYREQQQPWQSLLQ